MSDPCGHIYLTKQQERNADFVYDLYLKVNEWFNAFAEKPPGADWKIQYQAYENIEKIFVFFRDVFTDDLKQKYEIKDGNTHTDPAL